MSQFGIESGHDTLNDYFLHEKSHSCDSVMQNERMSCMYNGSVQSMEEAVNRFAKQLEVLLHDFKLLKESVQKLKA